MTHEDICRNCKHYKKTPEEGEEEINPLVWLCKNFYILNERSDFNHNKLCYCKFKLEHTVIESNNEEQRRFTKKQILCREKLEDEKKKCHNLTH